MRVYLAAPYAVRNELRYYAEDLAAAGHESTSTWLNATHDIYSGTLGNAIDLGMDYIDEHVSQDMDDVARSDVLILFTWDFSQALVPDLGPNSGGRHVETGIALALGVPVLVVGKPENVFHRGQCVVVKTWTEALKELQLLHNRRFGFTGSGS